MALPDDTLEAIRDFDGARDSAHPQSRVREVRRRAHMFRERMSSGPKVRYYRSFDLVGVPYPTHYGLRDAWAGPPSFMQIRNRLFVVQYDTEKGLRTLLVSPSDHRHGNRETPYFRRLRDRMGPLRGLGEQVLAPSYATVEEALAQTGIRPEQVDYITYDHLHTQDLRRWLGSFRHQAVFPNAKLLVMRQEWLSFEDLAPPQRDWYPPQGLQGVPRDKVILLDGDVALGDGVALLRTPGHTEGNHSIVVNTEAGLLVTSENGVGPDAYAPQASRMPGLRRFARQTGMDVVLNGNTLEGGLDQYISMVQEKEIAGPSPDNPAFPNVMCSSELTWHWAFPLVKPTYRRGELTFGEPTT